MTDLTSHRFESLLDIFSHKKYPLLIKQELMSYLPNLIQILHEKMTQTAQTDRKLVFRKLDRESDSLPFSESWSTVCA